MGPGFKSKINVSINKKPIRLFSAVSAQKVSNTNKLDNKSEPFIEKIVDNLDGSYNIIIANVSAEDNPDISIGIRGEILYEGKLKPIPIWFYIIIIILVIILILIQKNKSNPKIYKVLLWILLLFCLTIYFLHKFGIFYIL